MAEILGVISSGVAVAQLASSVTTSIIALKGYFEQIKDAPIELQSLVEEIESVNLILSHIAADQSRTRLVDNLCMQRSLELCEKGVKELSESVEELRRKVEGKSKFQRQVGKVKVMLKKEEIKGLKRRMKSAVRLLSLAYQCHTNAMIQLQPEIIITRIAEHASSSMMVTAVQADEDSDKAQDRRIKYARSGSKNLVTKQYEYWASSPSWLRFVLGSIEYKSHSSKLKENSPGGFYAKYRAPSWIASRVWDVQGTEAMSGWKMTLQTFRMISWESPMVKMIIDGDIDAVRDALKRKEVFITDRINNWQEDTLLHVAAKYNQLEICKLLLNEGIDGKAVDFDGSTALSSIDFMRNKNESLLLELASLPMKVSDYIDLIDDIQIFFRFDIPKTVFHMLQNEAYPPYNQQPISKRLEIGWVQDEDPELMALAVSPGSPTFTKEIVCSQDPYGSTLLHNVLVGFAYETQSHDDSRWRVLIRDILAAGPNLSRKNEKGETPLVYFIYYLVRRLNYYLSENQDQEAYEEFYLTIHLKLQIYLSELQRAGIDLEKYGEGEGPNLCWPAEDFCYWEPPLEAYSVIRIDYGPKPEDWCVRLGDPIGVVWYLGEFWEMVDEERWENCRGKSTVFPQANLVSQALQLCLHNAGGLQLLGSEDFHQLFEDKIDNIC